MIERSLAALGGEFMYALKKSHGEQQQIFINPRNCNIKVFDNYVQWWIFFENSLTEIQLDPEYHDPYWIDSYDNSRFFLAGGLYLASWKKNHIEYNAGERVY